MFLGKAVTSEDTHINEPSAFQQVVPTDILIGCTGVTFFLYTLTGNA